MAFGHRPDLILAATAVEALGEPHPSDRRGDGQNAKNTDQGNGGSLEDFRDDIVDAFGLSGKLDKGINHFAAPSKHAPEIPVGELSVAVRYRSLRIAIQ
jgi:hypothetical protein